MKQSNKKVQALISQLLELAYEITTETKVDVFVRYAAHIHEIQVTTYLNGWQAFRGSTRETLITLKPVLINSSIEAICYDLEKEVEYLKLIKEIKKGEEE